MQSWPFRFYLPLPQVPLPDDTVCYDVELPNEPRILEAFEGMVQLLSRWVYWQRDPERRAIVAANVFRDLYFRLEAHKCSPVRETAAGADEGNEQLIRQNPTNPCLLETSINGTDWCVFADLSKCVPAGTQPGSGTPQPAPGGGQQCYHAQFNSSNKWLLPTLVNAGDVLQITNAKGAASDGTVSWYCPNGALFQLGACFGSGSTSSGDPLNTSPHMTLLAHINGVYYNVYNTSLTIPGGVAAASVEFMVNDSNIADNYGDLTFDVCVTNNASATWTHTFDFTTSDGAFVGVSYPVGVSGVYSPGIGWKPDHIQSPAGVAWYNADDIKRTFASRTITDVDVQWSLTKGSFNTPGDAALNLSLNSTLLATSTFTALSNGSNQHTTWHGSQASATQIEFQLLVSKANSATYSGDATIEKIVISGVGTDPFI